MIRSAYLRSVRPVRAVGVLVVVCASLLGVTGSSAAPFSAPPTASGDDIRITPQTATQGDTFAVIFPVPSGVEATVQFDGSAVPAFAISVGLRRALIGTDPDVRAGSHTIVASVREARGDWRRVSRVVHLAAGDFGVRSLTLPPKTFGLINARNSAIERQALGRVLNRRTPVVWWQGTFQAPSSGPVSAAYGEQGIYNGHREWWHTGVDYAAPEGAPVTAANAGVVTLAQMLPLGGGTVVIDHGHGVLTEYLHLSAFAVRVGDRVVRGSRIGRVGATGVATGPNVHWSLFVNGIPVNPLFWTESRPGLTS